MAACVSVRASAVVRAGRSAPAASRAAACRAVAPRARAVRAAAPLAGRVALRGAVALPSLARAVRPAGRAATAGPVALFKQGKDSIQWVNVLFSFAAAAAFFVPLVLLPRPSLALVAGAVLGVVVFALLVEAVGDALRRRKLRLSGLEEAWLAKSEAIAAAARAKAAAGAQATQQARNWAERNVAGAASEEDAQLIRGMNEFLQ